MNNFFSFLWEHPSLTAILSFVILYIILYVRADNRNIDQMKDNMYGPVKGSMGRRLDREKKGRNAGILIYVAFYALCGFLIYRFLKFTGWG